ncbi:MAG: hypothetical protein AUJ92_16245 [Armatimonadetes bacterium CG2_30_59_28]|nr:MAG: hypothetical protein AUJ92_16245 [Armatimonadetes bacterium CG2_30_59_28]
MVLQSFGLDGQSLLLVALVLGALPQAMVLQSFGLDGRNLLLVALVPGALPQATLQAEDGN